MQNFTYGSDRLGKYLVWPSRCKILSKVDLLLHETHAICFRLVRDRISEFSEIFQKCQNDRSPKVNSLFHFIRQPNTNRLLRIHTKVVTNSLQQSGILLTHIADYRRNKPFAHGLLFIRQCCGRRSFFEFVQQSVKHIIVQGIKLLAVDIHCKSFSRCKVDLKLQPVRRKQDLHHRLLCKCLLTNTQRFKPSNRGGVNLITRQCLLVSPAFFFARLSFSDRLLILLFCVKFLFGFRCGLRLPFDAGSAQQLSLRPPGIRRYHPDSLRFTKTPRHPRLHICLQCFVKVRSTSRFPIFNRLAEEVAEGGSFKLRKSHLKT